MLLTKMTLIGLVRRVGVISLILLAAIPAGQAQQRTPPPIPAGTSAIRGRVIDSITKAPVAGCTLRIMASGTLATRVTDLAGAFELKDVAAGDYFFNVQCPAHRMNCFAGILTPCRHHPRERKRKLLSKRTCLIEVPAISSATKSTSL